MLSLMKLENRIVLDGAVVAGIIEHHTSEHDALSVIEHNTGEAHIPEHAVVDVNHTEAVANAAALLSDKNDNNDSQTETQNAATTEIQDTASVETLQNNAGVEVILISDSLPDYQQLAAAAKPGAYVIIYDADSESAADVIERITSLSNELGKQVDSVSILSHGGTGNFELGNENINASNIIAYADTWSALDNVLKDDGNIYLLGCNVSADGTGQTLLNRLAQATNSKVFASDDVTGLAGDWNLETASENADAGSADIPMYIEQLATYSDSLSGYSNTVTLNEDATYSFNSADFGTNYTSIKITDLENAGDLKLGDTDVYLNQEINISQIANLKFIPNKDANGDGYSSFKFKVNDGTGYGDTYTITVNVIPQQDAPSSVDNSVMIYEDNEYLFKANDFIFNDVDNTDSFARLQITQAPTSGTLMLNGSAIGLNSVIEYADIAKLVYVPALITTEMSIFSSK